MEAPRRSLVAVEGAHGASRRRPPPGRGEDGGIYGEALVCANVGAQGGQPCAVTAWVCVRLPSQPEQPGAQGRDD